MPLDDSDGTLSLHQHAPTQATFDLLRKPIRRIGKACEGCRKAKCRCDNIDEAPCVRCVGNSLECVYASGPNRKMDGTNQSGESDARISALETKLDQISSLLQHIVSQPTLAPALTAHQRLSQEQVPLSGQAGSPSSLLLHLASPPSISPLNNNFPSPNMPRFQDYSAFQSTSTSSSSSQPQIPLGRHSPVIQTTAQARPSAKRRRSREGPSPVEVAKSIPMVERNIFSQMGPPPPSARLSISHPTTPLPELNQFIDAVSKGVVSDATARELWAFYMANCSDFAPILDPRVDTYDNVRIHSPFVLNAALATAASYREHPNLPQYTVAALEAEALAMVQAAAISTVTRDETVQALAIMASFSTDATYLLIGQAVRSALELRMHKALAKLSDYVGTGASQSRLREDERRLVSHTRVWLYLAFMDWAVSLGLGRAHFYVNERNTDAQYATFLDSFASVSSDVTLVSNRQLMLILCAHTQQIIDFGEDPLNERHLQFAHNGIAELNAWASASKIQCIKRGEPAHCRWVSRQSQADTVLLISRILSRRGGAGTVDAVAAPRIEELGILALQSCLAAVELMLSGPLGTEAHKMRFACQTIFVEISFSALFVLRMLKVFPNRDPETVRLILSKVIQIVNCLSQSKRATRFCMTLKIALDRFRRSFDSPTTPENDPTLEAELDQLLLAPPFNSGGGGVLVSDIPNFATMQPPDIFFDPIPSWITDSTTELQMQSFGTGLEDLFLPQWTVDSDLWTTQ